MTLNPKQGFEIVLTSARGSKKYKLKVPQGALQIGTVSQDDTVYVRNVGKRVGDFDEQRSWKMGRGTENLSDNAEAFWDSSNAWTLTPGHVHQTLQWYHARGLRSEDMYMPTRSAGNVQFIPLLGAYKYIANSFSASASYSADKGYLWIRRRGSPASNLTFRLMSDSSGPDTALQTVTKTISNITDYISLYQVFDWTGTESLTSGTTYWISVHASASDDRDNCWEVGVNPDATSGKTSSDGSTWATAGFALYYRVTDADTARKWFTFNLKEAMYIIDRKDNGTTASVLYINGDRGKATAGASTTLTDSAKSWTTDRYANAWVKIINGTGIGQARQITSNTGTELTVSPAWNTNPSTDSEYVIYATEWFTSISLTGGSLSVCQSIPQVVNNVAYIPQGSTGICHIRWNNSTLATDASVESATGTSGLADILLAAQDPTDGPVLWRANNTSATGSGGLVTVSRAKLLSTATAFIAWNTALTWKTAIFTGSASYSITGLNKKDGSIYVWREDGMGIIANDRFNTIETGIEKTPSKATGALSLTHEQFLYYSWLHSIVRVYGSSHDDIGDDVRAFGLPDGREGNYSDGDSYLKWVFFGIDAGTGTSSVLAWDGLGWHEMIRARQAGDRIRMTRIQTCPETRNRLWINQGGDLTFQELPYNKTSPRLDSSARYQHEAVIESAAIDMGTASAMPKLIKELTATIKNMNTNGREVYVDFQTDDDVHTSNWTYAGVMTKSPESVVFLGINCNRFAYRLRICCNDNSIPVDIEGIVPNGYARVPFKMIFSMTVQSTGIFSRRGKAVSFGELTRWLIDESRIAGYVNMESVFELAHGWRVIIHPPRMTPIIPRKGKNPETGMNTLTLEEI